MDHSFPASTTDTHLTVEATYKWGTNAMTEKMEVTRFTSGIRKRLRGATEVRSTKVGERW
jgi:hypothetical protein